MAEADPLFWICDLGLGAPWDYRHYECLITAFIRADRRLRERTRRALPNVDCEAMIWESMRSRDRRN